MGFLCPERRVHDHGIAGPNQFPAPVFPYVHGKKWYVRTEKPGVFPGNNKCLLVDIHTGHRCSPQQHRTDGKNTGPTPEIENVLSLNVPFHQCVVKEPGGKRGRRLVLFEGCLRAGEPGEALEGHLELLKFHGISSMA